MNLICILIVLIIILVLIRTDIIFFYNLLFIKCVKINNKRIQDIWSNLNTIVKKYGNIETFIEKSMISLAINAEKQIVVDKINQLKETLSTKNTLFITDMDIIKNYQSLLTSNVLLKGKKKKKK